jgi:hypothetical protein
MLSSCLSTSALIVRFARLLLSINSFVVVTCLTAPNKPSRTNRCVCDPSSVPVSPNLYLQSSSFVSIDVNDFALNRCASSPIQHQTDRTISLASCKLIAKLRSQFVTSVSFISTCHDLMNVFIRFKSIVFKIFVQLCDKRNCRNNNQSL